MQFSKRSHRNIIAGAGISPVGYFRLGASAPRTMTRQYYWLGELELGGVEEEVVVVSTSPSNILGRLTIEPRTRGKVTSEPQYKGTVKVE